jgi:putative toxin-antitoxin system antitoxin component (TIGR02293 family)
LRLQATSFAELRDAVRSGLPFSAFLALSKQLEISPQHLTAIFGIPPRTVARRKEARHLNPQESDRLFGTRQVEEVLLCLNYGIFS